VCDRPPLAPSRPMRHEPASGRRPLVGVR
jgi:hypothetical protein